MLELRNIMLGYNAAPVVRGISLALQPGRIVALIGANGAGKSTTLKAISGAMALQSGEILLDGVRIDGLSPRERVLRGVAHIPEGRQIFAALSVLDNLKMGCFAQRGKLDTASMRQRIERVCALMPLLLDRLSEPAGNLSGGQQQMLSIARGLMSEPRVLLLDEPSLGLAPLLVNEVFRLVSALRDQGLAILLSEQNARLSLKIADYGYVVEKGVIATKGTGKDLLEDREVSRRYLGMEAGVAEDTARSQQLAPRLRALLHDMKLNDAASA